MIAAARTFAAMLFAGAAIAHAGTVSVTVIDKEGKPVNNAVVLVTSPKGGAPKPADKTIISQEKMQFVPPLTVVPVGTRVTFANNDRWEHHLRGTSADLSQMASGNASGFEMRLDAKAEGKPAASVDTVLDKRGPILLSCHIHGSMRGNIYVADTPWAARTSPQGQVDFTDVPDGPAQVRVWHAEQLIDLPAAAVTVGAAPAHATVQLQVVPRQRRL